MNRIIQSRCVISSNYVVLIVYIKLPLKMIAYLITTLRCLFLAGCKSGMIRIFLRDYRRPRAYDEKQALRTYVCECQQLRRESSHIVVELQNLLLADRHKSKG